MRNIKKGLLTLLMLLVGVTCLFAVACKKENKVEYIFDTNGGKEIANVSVEVGTEYTLPTPERDGYEFEGWYLTEDFTGEPVVTVVAEEGQTYYAKWAQLFAITLELDGGTLAEGSTLYLKAGANVYDFMQSYTPTKEGLTFGAWFLGEKELPKNTRMTEEGITLSAKYKVAYTIEIYKQNLALNDYEKDAENIVGSDYVGIEYTCEQSFTGFKQTKHEGEITSRVLSANASENIFKLYFDREKYKVSFNTNYPGDSEDETYSLETVYGKAVELPKDYTFGGYLLTGWSTSASGSTADYKVDAISDSLYNKDDSTTASDDTFIPERNTTLYGVWQQGYTDMFGGSDYIYLLDETSQDIYLSRGNVFFKGTYRDNKTFIFLDKNEEIIREGKLFDGGTYCYYDEARPDTVATFFKMGEGLNENIKLYFDAYNGITYSAKNEEGINENSEGSYVIDENGFYISTFTSGQLSGQTLTIALNIATTSAGTETTAFLVRNDEEYDMGVLVRFGVSNGEIVYYRNNIYAIILDGFGNAAYNTGSSTTAYYYTTDEDGTITLFDTETLSAVLALRIVEIGDQKGYMPYSAGLDQTFVADSGATLTTDGLYRVTYKDGNTTIEGFYTAENSAFGGVIVRFSDKQEEYTFMLSATTENVDGEDVTKYSFEKKPSGYAEYLYNQGDKVYKAPLLVINEAENVEASLYGGIFGYNSVTYVKVSEGTVEYDEETGLYTYTVSKHIDPEEEISKDPVDLETVDVIVFGLDSQLTSYNIAYWYSYSSGSGGAPTTLSKEYKSEDGKETLTLVGGFAVYRSGEKMITGLYSTSNGVTVVSTAEGTMYFELNEEKMTFIKLESVPYNAYLRNVDGSMDKNVYIHFDGKGNAVYTVVTEDEEGVESKKEISGTVEDTDRTTDFGSVISVFKSTEKTFDFLLLSNSSNVFFAPYNEAYSGEYSGDGILTLDGFGFKASWLDGGKTYEGTYSASENLVYIAFEDQYRYFDIDPENKTFTVRGKEYANYILIDNQLSSGIYIELDGYGNLKVYTLEKNESGETAPKYIDENGSYEIDGDVYTLHYNDGSKDVELTGKLAVMVSGSTAYNVFVVIRDEAVQTYVNAEDWSVLILDNLGNATKYTEKGKKEVGSYTLITDELLYYVNSEGTDACIYHYDTEAGSATPIKFTPTAYYTKDLESLVFSQYGFAIFNGETRYYYNIDENNEVTIYRQAKTGETANAYGFKEEDFGKFADTTTYGGKTYYKNNGYDLTFTRGEEGEKVNNYPVLVNEGEESHLYALEDLIFTPSGGTEFNVNGTVKINGVAYKCYVVRTDTEMYVRIDVGLGYYRFDISVDYTGADEDGRGVGTYIVTGLSRVIEAPSYSYLTMYYQFLIQGYLFDNVIGELSINTVYDEAGAETETYFAGTFGQLSGIYDINGKPVTVEHEVLSEEEASPSQSGLYTIEFELDDGYTYRIRFELEKHEIFGVYAYHLYAFTRVQQMEYGDYSFEVERVVATELNSLTAGSIFTVSDLKKNGESVENENSVTSVVQIDGVVYYIVREKDDAGKITSTVYYKIELVAEDAGTVPDTETEIIGAYESATVTEEQITTISSADGKSFIDVTSEDKVFLVSVNGSLFGVKENISHDEATGIYTVVLYSNETLKIEVKDGVLGEITVVEDTEENSSAA